MVAEVGADDPQGDARENVGDPVYAQVLDAEQVYREVGDEECVELPVPPLLERDAP